MMLFKKEEQDQTKPQNNLALRSWIVAHFDKDEAQERNMEEGRKSLTMQRYSKQEDLNVFYMMESLNNFY